MKKIITLCIFLAFSVHIHAQTASEVVSKYLESMGGTSGLSKVSSVKMAANIAAQGMEFPATILQKVPNKQKISFSFQGMEIVQPGFDGETGWQTNFLNMKFEKMNEEENAIMKQEAGDFPDPFLNYESKGYKIELLAPETVNGIECHSIKLIKKPLKISGEEVENSINYLIDKTTFLPVISRSMIKMGPAKGIIAETHFGNFTKVDGITFPFLIEQKVNGQTQASIKAENIEVNTVIDDALFVYPGN